MSYIKWNKKITPEKSFYQMDINSINKQTNK